MVLLSPSPQILFLGAVQFLCALNHAHERRQLWYWDRTAWPPNPDSKRLFLAIDVTRVAAHRYQEGTVFPRAASAALAKVLRKTLTNCAFHAWTHLVRCEREPLRFGAEAGVTFRKGVLSYHGLTQYRAAPRGTLLAMFEL